MTFPLQTAVPNWMLMQLAAKRMKMTMMPTETRSAGATHAHTSPKANAQQKNQRREEGKTGKVRDFTDTGTPNAAVGMYDDDDEDDVSFALSLWTMSPSQLKTNYSFICKHIIASTSFWPSLSPSPLSLHLHFFSRAIRATNCP
jgi:hypothetical protein